jgi:hypothetical protein
MNDSFERQFFTYLSQGLIIVISVVAAGRLLRVIKP